VTLEVDRGGRLAARALVPLLSQVFEQVAHLSIPDADPAVLGGHHRTLSDRLVAARARIDGDPRLTDRLIDVEWALQDAGSAIETGRGGDDDQAQRAHRLLIEADAALGEIEEATRWPALDRRVRESMTIASSWVSQFGTRQEQQMLTQAGSALEHARRELRADELERQLRAVDQLTTTAYYRHPEAWRWQFERAASDVGRCTDPGRAQALASEGRAALAAGDTDRLRAAVLGLHKLLPVETREPIPGYRSDLR
jgi:molecular chaperone DnaK